MRQVERYWAGGRQCGSWPEPASGTCHAAVTPGPSVTLPQPGYIRLACDPPRSGGWRQWSFAQREFWGVRNLTWLINAPLGQVRDKLIASVFSLSLIHISEPTRP